MTSSLVEILEDARARGLLGPMDLGLQVEHALGFARAFEQAHGLAGRDGEPAPARWLDLGSGGGLPGLVLAGHWASTPGVLLDSANRRTEFLSEAVHRLGWDDRIEVVRARAEEAGRDPGLRGSFDVVWARSFGSPPVTAECAAPLLAPGGLLVVSEPPTTAREDGSATPLRETPFDQKRPSDQEDREEGRWPRAGLEVLGQAPVLTVRAAFGYQVILQATPCPDRFPRRSGMPAKRPLYRVSEAP